VSMYLSLYLYLSLSLSLSLSPLHLSLLHHLSVISLSVLEKEALHGTTHDFVSVFLAQLVDVSKSAT
jgi:hypothetical protein